jgi:hypothetical protein
MFIILEHLMKVSVERPAPAGLPPVAVCTQTILIVTQPSHSTVRTLTPPAVTLTKAMSSIQCLYFCYDSASTFRMLMGKNCVLCEVGTGILNALYVDVGVLLTSSQLPPKGSPPTCVRTPS